MKITGIVLLVTGTALLVAALSADVIGIGDRAGFGPQQIGGAVTGLLITALGLFLMSKKKKTKD